MKTILLILLLAIGISSHAHADGPLMTSPANDAVIEYAEGEQAQVTFNWRVPYPGSKYFLEIYPNPKATKPWKTYPVTNKGKVSLKVPKKLQRFGWRIYRMKKNGEQTADRKVFTIEVKEKASLAGPSAWKAHLSIGPTEHEFGATGKFKDLTEAIKAKGTVFMGGLDRELDKYIVGFSFERSGLDDDTAKVTITRAGARFGGKFASSRSMLQRGHLYGRYHVITIDSVSTFNAEGSMKYMDTGFTYEADYLLSKYFTLGLVASLGVQIDPDPQPLYYALPFIDWNLGNWRLGLFGQYGKSKAFNVDDTYTAMGVGVKWAN
jgi:hypothetical protein